MRDDLQVTEPVAVASFGTTGNGRAEISKGGRLAAQETKVFQAAVLPNKALKATVVSKARRRRGTSQGCSDLILMMNVGAAADMDDFKLMSRSSSADAADGPQLEVGNCADGPAKPVFIGVKNDGWYGAVDFNMKLTMIDCTNCTGVSCSATMQCAEATGKYESPAALHVKCFVNKIRHAKMPGASVQVDLHESAASACESWTRTRTKWCEIACGSNLLLSSGPASAGGAAARPRGQLLSSSSALGADAHRLGDSEFGD